MKRKIIILFMLTFACGFATFAQTETQNSKKEEKTETRRKKKTKTDSLAKPKFSILPTATIFTKYTHGLGADKGTGGFSLDRAYLGAKFKYGNTLSGQVVLDFGSTKIEGSALDLVAYIKNASVTWKNYGFEASFGLIKTNNFSFQESFWGYRYVNKSYMDANKFASSADLGFSVAYKYKNWFKVDFQMTNGEGYKKLVLDDDYRYGLGLTFEPIENFYLRGFYDLYTSKEEGDKMIQTASFFAGYKHKYFSIAGEYNQQWNKGFENDNDLIGISFYATGYIIKQLEVFARYDQTFAKQANVSNEGSAIIAGVEYTPFKYLKISPNVKYFNPTGSDEDELTINLNLQVKF